MGLSLANFITSAFPLAEALIGVNGLLGFGIGLVVFGAAKGISSIASSAVESIARQPEAAGKISTAMIISAALIEGFTFFALVICMLAKQ